LQNVKNGDQGKLELYGEVDGESGPLERERIVRAYRAESVTPVHWIENESYEQMYRNPMLNL